jgi:hypothetical protein
MELEQWFYLHIDLCTLCARQQSPLHLPVALTHY